MPAASSQVAANIKYHSWEGVSFLTKMPAVAQVTLQPQTHSHPTARMAFGKHGSEFTLPGRGARGRLPIHLAAQSGTWTGTRL